MHRDSALLEVGVERHSIAFNAKTDKNCGDYYQGGVSVRKAAPVRQYFSREPQPRSIRPLTIDTAHTAEESECRNYQSDSLVN